MVVPINPTTKRTNEHDEASKRHIQVNPAEDIQKENNDKGKTFAGEYQLSQKGRVTLNFHELTNASELSTEQIGLLQESYNKDATEAHDPSRQVVRSKYKLPAIQIGKMNDYIHLAETLDPNNKVRSSSKTSNSQSGIVSSMSRLSGASNAQVMSRQDQALLPILSHSKVNSIA
jgi:hypothetical protein